MPIGSTPESTIVHDGRAGLVSRPDEEFVAHATCLNSGSELRRQMGQAAVEVALAPSWDAVFELLYDAANVSAIA